jgi:hypothetical protein
MRIKHWTGGLLGFAVATALIVGCEKTEDKVQNKPKPKHDKWWCDEHGIPEADCSMCLPAAEVKKRFKDKGDWCKEHKRAKSQCFICDPKLKEEFAAKYRAKYGEEPPPIEEEEEEKKKGGKG